MKTAVLAIIPVLLGLLRLEAEPPEVQSVRGPGFDGEIFTPDRVHQDVSPGFYRQSEMWTPSPKMVLQTEKALPSAIAFWISGATPVQGANFPTCCPSKIGTNLRFTNAAPDPRPDSVIVSHDFLYDVAPLLSKYKRQYVGATVDGKRVIYLSFIYVPTIDYVPELRKCWKEKHWIAVLGGGDDFWSVLYDPASGSFSDWEG